ncbi:MULTISPECIES: 5-carboxymethyl-2-hydroxymuconate Delta-isomerase [Streptomyces]|uniref:5-carboxymethyl-2-hydroxymuconate Delta-isomerase n=2 Tax=Streptomyces TaxID=1883 RepID=A0ABV9J0X9_9ACTN
MPQITVDYSPAMSRAFDEEEFAKALHASVVEIAAAKPEACKTLFRKADSAAYAYQDLAVEEHAIVHVTLGLLAGRSDETKARLTEAVLELLREHVENEDFVLHASAEVRDLDPSYRKYEG